MTRPGGTGWGSIPPEPTREEAHREAERFSRAFWKGYGENGPTFEQYLACYAEWGYSIPPKEKEAANERS